MLRKQLSHLLAAAGFCSQILAIAAVPARASGTMFIEQRDGSTSVYKDVLIRVKDWAMALASADGDGMLVIGKASCTQVGALLRCLPYDATLTQYGASYHIPIRSGTIWINPTTQGQPLTYSSAHLESRGVLLSLQTKAGTYVSLTGKIDETQK